MPRFRRLVEIPSRTVEAWKRGDHNPSTLIRVDGDPQVRLFGGAPGPHYLASDCGSGDEISVFQHGVGDDADVYVLAINRRLPYLGVDRFHLADEASEQYEHAVRRTPIFAIPSAGSVFLQNDHEFDDVLGPQWTERGDRWLIEQLMDRL